MIDENGKAITFLSLEEKGLVSLCCSLLSKGATAWKLDHTPVPEGQEIFLQNIKEKRNGKIGSVF